MNTTEELLSPYVSIGTSRFCKYCEKPIDKYHHFCDCEDSKQLQDVCHKVMELDIKRTKLVRSAPKPKFTATITLTPVSYGSSDIINVSDDEPPVNV